MAYGTSMSQMKGWDNRKPGAGLPERKQAIENVYSDPMLQGNEETVPQLMLGQPMMPENYRMAALNRALSPIQKINPKYMDYDINKMG